jgi:hypothetical protein
VKKQNCLSIDIYLKKFIQPLIGIFKKHQDLKFSMEDSILKGNITIFQNASSHFKFTKIDSAFYTEKIEWKSPNSKLISNRKYFSGN